MAQNVKKVASKNLKKPKVAENSKSCQNSKKLPKISKVAEKLPSNLWLSLAAMVQSLDPYLLQGRIQIIQKEATTTTIFFKFTLKLIKEDLYIHHRMIKENN